MHGERTSRLNCLSYFRVVSQPVSTYLGIIVHEQPDLQTCQDAREAICRRCWRSPSGWAGRFRLPGPSRRRARTAGSNADAASAGEMKAYTELIEHTEATIDMVPIPGGEFLMGSPASEEGRADDEGPQHKVKLDPFWMSKCEITWDAFEIWMFDLDIQQYKAIKKITANERDKAAKSTSFRSPRPPTRI